MSDFDPDDSDGDGGDSLMEAVARSLVPVDGIAPGDRMGRYTIVSRLGAGGMGIVYAAFDPELDRRVAIKVLHPDASRHPGARARLVREAKAMAALAHPNVITVHDVGAVDEHVFLAMELVEPGTTLRAWLASQQRTRNEIITMFSQAGRGLAAAHSAGLIHRDFKADNVLVDAGGRARVGDFGLARADGGAGEPVTGEPVAGTGETGGSEVHIQHTVTRGGAILGTPRYMSPEQKRGDAEAIDARSDQYSFCVALDEALRGRKPRWLKRVLARGRSEHPAQRFASMNELLVALAGPSKVRRALPWLVATAVLGSAAAVFILFVRNRAAPIHASGCGFEGDVEIQVYSSRAAFDAAIGRDARVVDFDDIDTSNGLATFAPDHYRDRGVIIRGTDGQFVDRDFGYPNDFIPSSPPNAYAPGPTASPKGKLGDGGSTTDLTFVNANDHDACVSAIGVDFIDVDWTYAGEPIGLAVFDAANTRLGRANPPIEKSGSRQFRGLVARDRNGKLAPVIARTRIVNGTGWVEVYENEGAVLDNLVFAIPL